jgi:hypothetical protein
MRYEILTRGIPIVFCAGFVLGFAAYSVSAGESELGTTAEKNSALEQDEPGVSYEAEGSLYIGYRFLSREDSVKAAEYVYPHSSIIFGMDLLAAPLPHRYHLNGEFLSKYDYYTDTGYAYQDLVLFRDILVGAHHNLDHFNYLYQGSPPSLSYVDRNQGDTYFIDYVNNLFSLRLKTPDFPFHAFVRHRYVGREGDTEERFVLGSFDNLTKTSETRSIDWTSNAVTLGANSHLGPVEIEYAYDQEDFDPGRNSILYDQYPFSLSFPRPEDIYPHGVVPETESSANTLKMHTSYTGGIVAAATFSNLAQQNNYSGTESTTWKGAFDFSWVPDPVVGLFFKYRHKKLDLDNPDTVTLHGAVNTLRYPVRQGISYDRNQFLLTARYKPMTSLTLLSTYDYSRLDRGDLDDWAVLPEKTDRHNLNLTAHARPLNTLKLKADYDYTYYDSPAYNTQPDNSNRLRLSATYLPVSWLTVFANYVLAVSERDDLRYLNSEPHLVLEGGERDGRTDHFLGSLTFAFSPRGALTSSWAYNRWKVEQDLTYGQWNTMGTSGDFPYYDRGVFYADESNTLALSLYYLLRKDLTLTADLNYTFAEGEHRGGNVIQGDPASPVSFSSMETTETIVSVGLARRVLENWEVGLRFSADFYDDAFSVDSGDGQDGELYITTVSLKRYF